MDIPLVSVLITAYNREAYIGDTIESVLSTTYPNFELIIVDDCSSDNTLKIAQGYSHTNKKIRVYKNTENIGDYNNRNKAASYANGVYLKYVDSDDRIFPDSLTHMVNHMKQFPNAALGFCDERLTRDDIYPLLYTGAHALRKHFLGGGLLLAGPASAIIRTDAFRDLGGFSGKRYISDYEAWLKLCLKYDVVVMKPGLMFIRTHPGQEKDLGKLEYYHLNYNLHKSFLRIPEAPFSQSEKKKLLFNYKVLLGRRCYQRLIKWYGFKKTLETLRLAGETPSVLITAFLPMKRLKY